MPLHLSLKRGEGFTIGSDIVIVIVLDKTHPSRLAVAITAPRDLAIRKFGAKNRQEGEVDNMTKV